MKLLTVLIGVIIFLSSCSHSEKKNFDVLFFITLTADNTTSFKIATSDTLFRQIKYPQSTKYTYIVLTKAERKELNHLVGQLQITRTSESQFAIGPNQSLLFISSDTSKAYYTDQIRTNDPTYISLARWFGTFKQNRSFLDVKTNFWNVKGILEPPGPPIPLDSTKFLMPLTLHLQKHGRRTTFQL